LVGVNHPIAIQRGRYDGKVPPPPFEVIGSGELFASLEDFCHAERG